MAQIKTETAWEKQIRINTVTGAPNADNYKRVIKANMADGVPKYAIWDYTNSDLSVLTSKDLKSIMAFTLKQPHSSDFEKIALILPKDLSYGLGRMFETFAEIKEAPWELRPFHGAAEAFHWVGVEDIRETGDVVRQEFMYTF